MGIPVLAQNLTAFLAPFLPYLVQAGVEAGQEAAKRLSSHLADDAWKQAQTLWGKLCPTVEARPAAQEAVEDVAADPQDEEAKVALKRQRLVNAGDAGQDRGLTPAAAARHALGRDPGRQPRPVRLVRRSGRGPAGAHQP